jgi:hypothetical protein
MASVNYQKLGFVTNRTHLPSPTPSSRVHCANARTNGEGVDPTAARGTLGRAQELASNSLEVFEVF